MTREIPLWARDVALRLGADVDDPIWSSSETFSLRAAVLEVTSDRVPRTAAHLFARVVEEWGEVSERRLWRALRWQVERGAIVRVGAKWHSEGYVRAAGVVPGQGLRAA